MIGTGFHAEPGGDEASPLPLDLVGSSDVTDEPDGTCTVVTPSGTEGSVTISAPAAPESAW